MNSPYPRPALSATVTTAALALLTALAAPGTAQAADSSLSLSASFTASGGDARYGTGTTPDTSFSPIVYDLLPLFDPALGVLERVSFTLNGWRSLEATCTSPALAEVPGACSARIDGAFFLDGLNLNTWPQEAPMASINPVISELTVVWPAIGTSLPINLLATASASGEISDPALLASFFTASGLPNQGIRLRFSPQDSGYFGMGGGAGFTAMLWDADATVNLTYHYTASVVPEPAGWATLAAGLGVLGWLRRRRGAPRR